MALRHPRLLTAVAAVTAITGLAACGGSIPLRTVGTTAPPAAPPFTGGGPTTPTTLPVGTPGTAGPGTTPTTTPTTTPKAVSLPRTTGRRPGGALFRRVLADASAKRWVHDTATVPGATATVPVTHFTSDDGPAEGTQEISVGPLDGEIRVVGHRTWIHGTAETLAGLFAVPAQTAESVGGRWALLKAGDTEYSSVTAGVTLASLLGEVAFAGKIIAGTVELDGTRRTVVEGRLATSAGTGDGVLYLTSGSRPLPLLWEQIGTEGTSRSTFSDWGHAVTVTAPAGAVALPAVPGGATTTADPLPVVQAARTTGPRAATTIGR